MVSNYAVSRIRSVEKKTIGWTAVALGICLGVCGLAVLDHIWANSETVSGGFELLAATVFGFTLLFASVIAIRNPRRAGLVLLTELTPPSSLTSKHFLVNLVWVVLRLPAR